MKVVFDANIYVSALHRGRKPQELVERVVNKLDTLFTTDDIVSEVERVLKKPKFRYSQNDVSVYVEMIKRNSKIVTIPPHISINVCRDSTDNKILECAVTAQANYIVSGDDDLLVLNPYNGIQIVNAAEYLDIVNPS